ncbi:MAG: FKBP-type peptidyl-prolyl cis-trans isomerase [Treponema sp.]|jgi:FKBP-type peptidyl-prolyl cis-trans isomerase|nr:FKBP-type peptidyl-prolyl cis-trans isomerase [Treponema sp.]
MKKFVFVFLGLVAASSLYARAVLDSGVDPEKTDNSYAYGLVIGSDLKGTGIEFDYYAIAQGLRDAIEERESRFSIDEAISLVQQSFQAAMDQQAEENRRKESQFFVENGAREGVITTESGLQYEAVHVAGGEKPGPQALVRVNYEGKLTDGTIFDSSYEREEPADIPLDRVIPGWSEGLQLMGVGDTYTLYIPSRLGYGEEGAGQAIPPYSPLIFKVELLEILRQVPAARPVPPGGGEASGATGPGSAGQDTR